MTYLFYYEELSESLSEHSRYTVNNSVHFGSHVDIEYSGGYVTDGLEMICKNRKYVRVPCVNCEVLLSLEGKGKPPFLKNLVDVSPETLVAW